MLKIYTTSEKNKFYKEIEENTGGDYLIVLKNDINLCETRHISKINKGKYSIFAGSNYIMMKPSRFVEDNSIHFSDKNLEQVINEI